MWLQDALSLYRWHDFNELMQERRNFIANASELRFFCNNPSIYVSVLSKQARM